MMREIFLLVLALGACTALEDPPVEAVMQHNLEIAPSMINNSGVGIEEFTKDKFSAVNMSIVAVLPSVDGRIPPETEGVLWASYEEYTFKILHEDGDGCPDKYTYVLQNSSRYVEMNFKFRNLTEGGEIQMDEPIVGIPFEPSLLETANGSENLTIELYWHCWHYFEVTKKINNMVCLGEDCDCEYEEPVEWMENVTSIGNVSQQYIVESGNVSFFLVRPALEEQWYRNNHFDTLELSRKSIYKAEIGMDGEPVASAQIYNFSIMEDAVGAWHILVNETRDFENATMGNYELAYLGTPVSEDRIGFSHLYEVNYSYKGLGPHLLNVTVTDFFGDSYAFEKEIYSRKLTYGGGSETGEPAGSEEYYRPGIPPVDDGEISHNIIRSNEFFLIFLIAAVTVFWYYKGRGKSR